MAKLLRTETKYRLYPKLQMLCGCCHRKFVSEPFILEYKYYVHDKVTCKARCWRCVRSKEAVELIYNKWPGLYKITKKGQYYYLDYTDRVADVFAVMFL